MEESTVTSGGFFGDDGFTLPDLGVLLDLGTDTFESVFGAATGSYAPTSSYGPGVTGPASAQSFTGVYIGIGLVVLLLVVLVFVIARK